MQQTIVENNPKTTSTPSFSELDPKTKIIRMIVDFIMGFILLSIILLLHAYATQTQFWGLIYDTKVALSVVLLIIFIILMIYFIKQKRVFVPLGSVVAFPILYALSEAVQEGFGIFLYYI